MIPIVILLLIIVGSFSGIQYIDSQMANKSFSPTPTPVEIYKYPTPTPYIEVTLAPTRKEATNNKQGIENKTPEVTSPTKQNEQSGNSKPQSLPFQLPPLQFWSNPSPTPTPLAVDYNSIFWSIIGKFEDVEKCNLKYKGEINQGKGLEAELTNDECLQLLFSTYDNINKIKWESKFRRVYLMLDSARNQYYNALTFRAYEDTYLSEARQYVSQAKIEWSSVSN